MAETEQPRCIEEDLVFLSSIHLTLTWFCAACHRQFVLMRNSSHRNAPRRVGDSPSVPIKCHTPPVN